MSKQETNILKGIALLMLIMVHVNAWPLNLFVKIEGYSLWSLIGGICHPVAFFLMLSGYGLRYVYENGDRHHYGRIIKVFVHYWVIMLLFVCIGAIKIGPNIYPGDVAKIIYNITSFHTSYNYECWFLFPFAILSLSYPLIFKIHDRMGVIFIFVACLLYFGSGYIISHFSLIYKTAPHGLYNLIQIFYLLFSFAIGASFKKYRIVEKVKMMSRKKVLKLFAYIMILLMMFEGMIIKTTAFGCFEAFILFLLLLIIIQGRQCKVLKLIGKHSMNIWMIHTYFLHYIFHEEIYELRYTVLIFMATLCLSLLTSYAINIITAKIDKQIYKQNI